ncbi:ATP-binding protein [Acutalibacter caecimuris]|uniref:ATP-binding protein n=1 Tax=Acutalibacter caecimuris TaxID=3093657 RepID=UPI002AC8C59F|nr:ATP-binding protein [Acutalibacter sp. M00118]
MLVSKKRNIFVVGPEATGDSFLGRKTEVEKLDEDIFLNEGTCHLVGVPRIGKSSLIKRVLSLHADDEDCLILKRNMGESNSAFQFWCSVWEGILSGLEEKGIPLTSFQPFLDQLQAIDGDDPKWYFRMNGPIKRLCCALGKNKLRLILVIDEFDAVLEVFGQDNCHYQLLRTLASEREHAVTCVVVSRKSLSLLESRASSLSTFHGVFPSQRILGFNHRDMEEVYNTLATYDIQLTDSASEQITYYTGNIPMLCCMLCKRMVDEYRGQPVDVDLIDELWRDSRERVYTYYDDLISHLQKDGFLDELSSILFLKGKSVNKALKERMEDMGILRPLVSEDGFYAYSQDFTTYLKLSKLNLPTWDLIIAVEERLKELMVSEYPQLMQDEFKNLSEEKCNKINDITGLRLCWKTVSGNCRKLIAHKDEIFLIDGLGFGFVVDCILYEKNWKSRFSKRFPANDGDWYARLELMRKIRDPLAHSHGKYLSDSDLAQCNRYCEELIKLDLA